MLEITFWIHKKRSPSIGERFLITVVMNPFPKINHFKTPAPIPHQSAMKLHGNA